MSKVIKLADYRARSSSGAGEPSGVDVDLVLLGALPWIWSAVRVVAAIVHHEPFEAEATLALGCAVGLPWLLVRGLLERRWRRRIRSGGSAR